jgi:hypothetical protein
MITYIEAIGQGFSDVGCHCVGNGADYNSIIWDSGNPIPAQSDLDLWIITYEKNLVRLAIQEERDRRRSGGIKVGLNWFHSDDTSRIQQLGLVMFGVNMPSNIMWKTMSGSFVLMTPTLASQIFQASAMSDMVLFAYAEQKKSELLASIDYNTFDYLTGWPAIYGE